MSGWNWREREEFIRTLRRGKPRLTRSASGGWLCTQVGSLACGHGKTPAEAFEHWATARDIEISVERQRVLFTPLAKQ
jgi:hypothetical protein